MYTVTAYILHSKQKDTVYSTCDMIRYITRIAAVIFTLSFIFSDADFSLGVTSGIHSMIKGRTSFTRSIVYCTAVKFLRTTSVQLEVFCVLPRILRSFVYLGCKKYQEDSN
jgi:hypothetical protein